MASGHPANTHERVDLSHVHVSLFLNLHKTIPFLFLKNCSCHFGEGVFSVHLVDVRTEFDKKNVLVLEAGQFV